MASYELVFLADPRLSDEEAVALTDDFKTLLQEGGAEVAKEESWGKRRLAYPIQKLNEAYYVILTLEADPEGNPFPVVEQRLRQHDKILRYLTVRLDAGRLRHRERMPQIGQAPVKGGKREASAP